MKKYVLILIILLVAGNLVAIRMINPRGGVVWFKGEAFTITWDPVVTPDGNFFIQLFKGKIKVLDIAENIGVSTHRYRWLLPRSINNGEYVIRVGMAGSTSYAYSGKFKIAERDSSIRKRPPRRDDLILTDPQWDIEVTDLWLNKSGKLWIKYTNNSKVRLAKTLWCKIYVGGTRVYGGRHALRIPAGKWMAHAVNYSCTTIAGIRKSINVRGYIDAENDLVEVNESNNILTKILTCKLLAPRIIIKKN